MNGGTWWTVFAVGFVAIALSETFLPYRRLGTSTARRWMNNSILMATASAAIALVYQLSSIALSVTLQASAHGALNKVHLPEVARVAIGFTALDLTFYFSHRLIHAVGVLWRFHKVHHAESDLDLTTGFRFHPFEGLVSQGFLLIVIALLGPPPSAALLFSMAVVTQNFLTHANLRLPETLDRALRLVLITPGLHRVHHSNRYEEQNTNFGSLFSLWDRIFGTYNSEAIFTGKESHCGLSEVTNGSAMNAGQMLLLPFRQEVKSSTRISSDEGTGEVGVES